MIYALVTVNVLMVTLVIWGLVILFKYFPREGSNSYVYFHNLDCYLVKGEGGSEKVFVSIPITNGVMQFQITRNELLLFKDGGDDSNYIRFPVTEISRSELNEKISGSPVVLVDD